MRRAPLTSSLLAAVGYDPALSGLELEFVAGDVYQYFAVPEMHFLALLSADSPAATSAATSATASPRRAGDAGALWTAADAHGLNTARWRLCRGGSTMSAVTTLPFSRALTYDDLADLPDDGHRYELVDGVLIVSPSPVTRHQRIVGNLYLVLRASCPADLEVFLAPFDVVLADDTVLIPDLLVARRSDLTERNLPAAPVLAVEVLSPSTRRFDLMVKHSRLEAAGCAHYLVVDPDVPSMILWSLRDGAFVEVARAARDDAVTLGVPYPITIVPSALLGDGPVTR